MTPLRILVIDDHRDMAESLCEFLEMDGHFVDAAFTGEAGIQAALDTDYDAILMDIVLPDIPGTDALAAIKKEKPDKRIFLMSGYSADQLDQEAVEGGPVDVLVKPLDLDALSNRLAIIRDQIAR